jgi:hypothetical protein
MAPASISRKTIFRRADSSNIRRSSYGGVILIMPYLPRAGGQMLELSEVLLPQLLY